MGCESVIHSCWSERLTNSSRLLRHLSYQTSDDRYIIYSPGKVTRPGYMKKNYITQYVAKMSGKKNLGLQEALDLLQHLSSEISDVLTNEFSDEELPANNLLSIR
ncbi:hypothetical protein TNCV_2540071 [Trichonephila clavipes]|nr:hypothetical protein TNCV_2540071 [Trichonephila clavipes]